MFKLAEREDVQQILDIFKQAKQRMKDDGCAQWPDNHLESYPNQQIIDQDIAQKNLYKVEVDGQVAGVIACNSEFYYTFDSEESETEVLHRIAIDNRFVGQGIGRRLMTGIEQVAKERGTKFILVDTREDNSKMRKLIEANDYSYVRNFTGYDNTDNWVIYQKNI